MTWAERIPGAIAKAGGLLEEAKAWKTGSTGTSPVQSLAALGPDAVALAKALWGWEENYSYIREDILVPEERGLPDPALRAFVEKVEAL